MRYLYILVLLTCMGCAKQSGDKLSYEYIGKFVSCEIHQGNWSASTKITIVTDTGMIVIGAFANGKEAYPVGMAYGDSLFLKNKRYITKSKSH